MTLKQYIILMAIATLLCFAALGLVMVNVDPFTATGPVLAFFYATVFLSLCGALSLVVFGLYTLFSRRVVPLYRIVQKSFRDSIIISLTGTIMLFLQSQQLVNGLNAIFLLLLCIGLFIFFMTSDRRALPPRV